MDRDEIVTIVLNRCGNQAGNDTLRAALETEVQLIQYKLEENPQLPWFLITEYNTRVTTANESRVPIPADFLLELDESDLWLLDDGREWALDKDDNDALKNRWEGYDPQRPQAYALVGPYFRLYPQPDAAYQLGMLYYAKQAELTDLVLENAWTTNAADLLVAELGVIASGQYHKDQATADRFLLDLQRAAKRLSDKSIAREEVNVNRMMGD